MSQKRLDQSLVELGLVRSRSQAERLIKLGLVSLNGRVIKKPGLLVADHQLPQLKLAASEQYVSRAALKLDSVADQFRLDFKNKTVLDVGSSTGGFSDYALRRGAALVIAVDVGTDQMHPTLRLNPKLELHEKTDIRQFKLKAPPGIVLMDLSFISLRQILPALGRQLDSKTTIIAMVKPQFEAGESDLKHKGVIKNDRLRRDILKNFESWVKDYYLITAKADSAISGLKGNKERFYLLKKRA